jgi:5'-3' exonuclease
VPPEISAQFDSVEEGVRALGVTVWSMKQWEADDALATGAARFRDQVEQVRILTPDKDLGQCLRGEKVVQVDRRREKEITEATLRAEKGIGPESIPDWLALVGDDADGIPGLPGFGEKGAAALLGVYKKLEAIPDDYAFWKVKLRGADKLGAALRTYKQEARLYRTLATLVEDVPLPESLAQLEWRGAPRGAFTAWCQKMGAQTLSTRPHRWVEG